MFLRYINRVPSITLKCSSLSAVRSTTKTDVSAFVPQLLEVHVGLSRQVVTRSFWTQFQLRQREYYSESDSKSGRYDDEDFDEIRSARRDYSGGSSDRSNRFSWKPRKTFDYEDTAKRYEGRRFDLGRSHERNTNVAWQPRSSFKHQGDDWFQEENYNNPSFNRSGGFDGRSDFGNKLLDRDWDPKDLPELVKNLYKPSEVTLNRSLDEVEAFRAENKIVIAQGGSNVPNPILSFSEANFPPRILSALEKSGFDKPMPIQSQGWPIVLSGSDLVGIGETGSGKTLGFVLPAILHIQAQKALKPGPGPFVLVLAPTRELARQIESVAHTFGKVEKLNTLCVYGGASKGFQIQALSRGADMVIATPGRMIDLLEMGAIDLYRCSYVVLDEADRCLDMGFEPQIRKILSQIRPDRQMLMWSATWPKEVRDLARDFFASNKTSGNDGNGYVHLKIGSTELQANHNIEQKIEVLNDKGLKISRLLEIMRTIKTEALNESDEGFDPKDRSAGRTLIFAETKKSVDFLDTILRREGYKTISIHGDRSQRLRDQALQDFREGYKQILVATDVAARGIDVDNIKYVINFDFPKTIEDYIHRIGRTGRRGRKGIAYTFACDLSPKLVDDLVKVMEEAGQEVPLELKTHRWNSNESSRSFKGYGGGYNSGGGGGRYNRTYVSQDRYNDRGHRNWND